MLPGVGWGVRYPLTRLKDGYWLYGSGDARAVCIISCQQRIQGSHILVSHRHTPLASSRTPRWDPPSHIEWDSCRLGSRLVRAVRCQREVVRQRSARTIRKTSARCRSIVAETESSSYSTVRCYDGQRNDQGGEEHRTGGPGWIQCFDHCSRLGAGSSRLICVVFISHRAFMKIQTRTSPARIIHSARGRVRRTVRRLG